jgi:threonine/homoserine/homoserine lactone efflux protein
LYLGSVTRRWRAIAFGSAAALVVAGALCAAVIGGLTGQVLAIALITVGLGGALLLLFLEVGLSEDRARAREEERRRRRGAKRVGPERPVRLPRRPRRPG